MKKWIKVVGARQHNLKNISVDIPKDSLTVITGPSGSGKSTLALDILYAEGKRRYMESLSAYARQFLGIPPKSDVDRIEGLCPALAIEQKTVGSNPRSTVGTITEIYDYLRVLFARIGQQHCPSCKKAIQASTPQHITEIIYKNWKNKSITIMAPLAQLKKGEFTGELENLFKQGYYKYLINGTSYRFKSLEEIQKLKLKKTQQHSIDRVIDICQVDPDGQSRILEGLEKAAQLAQGTCKISIGREVYSYSTARMCLDCGTSFEELEPRIFSFNSPLGACKQCHGLGVTLEYAYHSLWHGSSAHELAGNQRGVRELTCNTCYGKRLHERILAVLIDDKNIYDVGQLSIKQSLAFFEQLILTPQQRVIVKGLLQEIRNRLTFLCDVGLEYLSINRTARTLSGGEGQRIRLATHIGSALTGVLYVLDEPSIGLHQRDNDRLIKTLHKLRDQGNTVVVVEHDSDTMLNADHIIDMGPAAGVLGGQVIATGSPKALKANKVSLTGLYLKGAKKITRSAMIRKPNNFMTLSNAKTHNLKNISVKIPLDVLCGISGVSGSGKSSLVVHELVPAIQRVLKNPKEKDDQLQGAENLEALVVIDQSPIGRTPRSNPATYLGIFDDIRRLFAQLPESNARGYAIGRFSFNVGEGRCAECSGEGTLTVSMHFLPDVTMLCNRCKGLRYNQQTLEITYKNKNIAEILAMTAYEAAEFFAAHPILSKRLKLLCKVGLDYLTLGQPSTTLSGGEAQRIKLVDELAKRGNKTMYILDEPTTGLHMHDIEKLLNVFARLIDKGNTIIVIEHNLDLLKTVDYLIDLGPEGGEGGGRIIAQGTPEQVAQIKESYTGRYLKNLMNNTKQG
ncbi:MAG: excinuclease ABC subunit UvrA [Candidatus Babeliaceae bacterium]